jgi:hypothetical protein
MGAIDCGLYYGAFYIKLVLKYASRAAISPVFRAFRGVNCYIALGECFLLSPFGLIIDMKFKRAS